MDSLETGAIVISIAHVKKDSEEGTFVLLPAASEGGRSVALFSDGSYTHWTPKTS